MLMLMLMLTVCVCVCVDVDVDVDVDSVCVCVDVVSLAPMRDKFRQYDVKKRGYLTADEAFPILKRELGFDESKTEALVDMFDKNRDYRLSLLEFVEFQRKVDEL